MSSPARKLASDRERARRLVLFDIDGTILSSDGAGRRAVFQALEEHFGKSGPGEHRFDGKTDPQIVRELMRHAGVSDADIDARLDEVLDRYVALLRDELASADHRQHIFPGVCELLDKLEARGDVVLGLLTGNIHHGARAKLAAVGIDPDRFVVGAFGSDHHERRPRVHGGEGADLECVEHAEDVELPLLREIRRVGEECEGDVHGAKVACQATVCDASAPV